MKLSKPQYAKDLGFTDEQIDAVQQYLDWLSNKRLRSRLAPLYAEIDSQYPELDREERDEMVIALFKKQQGEFALKSRHSATETAE